MTTLTLSNLKEEAKKIGVSFANNITTDALAQKINNHLALQQLEENKGIISSKIVDLNNETPQQLKMRLRKEALRLVRIRLSCVNPLKRDWEGEVFTVDSNITGVQRRNVPFNNEAGWHVPQIMLEFIKERKFQTFTTKTIKGREVKKAVLVKEFLVEVLPPLTTKELEDLAHQEAMTA